MAGLGSSLAAAELTSGKGIRVAMEAGPGGGLVGGSSLLSHGGGGGGGASGDMGTKARTHPAQRRPVAFQGIP